MKFFADTANIMDIRELNDFGLLGGVTTNPSPILRSGGSIAEATREISSTVDGPVSTEYKDMMPEVAMRTKNRRRHLHQGAANPRRAEDL